MNQIVRVTACFVRKISGKPIGDPEILVKVYDNDLVGDDLLGQSNLDKGGCTEVMFYLKSAKSPDSVFERKPDIYFELYKNDSVIYQSRVFKNVDFLQKDDVSGETRLTRDFGIFEVD